MWIPPLVAYGSGASIEALLVTPREGMYVVLGFDPGGDAQFGWAVLERTDAGLLRSRAKGTAGHAEAALRDTLAHIGPKDRVLGAGIDSPMYWTGTGQRTADRAVRNAITRQGARAASGTVQHPNSLRGACVVQGPVLALLLRRAFPDVLITEAHPKALLWLLGVARKDRPAEAVTGAELSHFVESSALNGEHERDAVIAALAARGMVDQLPGWVDLVNDEVNPIFIAGPVGYWVPLPPPSRIASVSLR